MDHDRLFKELLGAFFREFLDLFLPDLAASIDPDTDIVALDKEIFTDIALDQTHEVDLVMRVRLRDTEAFFLIHVENQSTPQSDFPKRMFRYFARLTERYDLPIYPVAVFSYDSPRRAEPDFFEVSFPQKRVLRFDYTVIQLNRLSWRQFVGRPNPVAAALMAKMAVAPRDRPRVKAECLRLLASLRLDPARARVVGVFVESYLELTAQEMRRFERLLARLAPAEREATMELMTSWERKGRDEGLTQGLAQGLTQGLAQGLTQGKEALVARQLRRRLGAGAVPEAVEARLAGLSAEQLDNLGEALLDFTAPADLDAWLDRNGRNA